LGFGADVCVVGGFALLLCAQALEAMSQKHFQESPAELQIPRLRSG
jgi:hypothetical protein